MTMIKLYRTLLCLGAALLALTAHAEEKSWYQVEVLVFANRDASALDDEFWPQGLEIEHPTNAVRLHPPLDRSAKFDAFELLPTASLLLNDEKGQIKRLQNYSVLYHAGWLQPVEDDRNARPIHIQAGEMLDNGMYELEGYITVDRGRYLHFKPDLYHSRKLSAYEADMLRDFLNAGKPPVVSTLQLAEEEEPATLADVQLPAPTVGAVEIPDFLTVNLKQGRRMRSEEVHYLDHPLMGVLVVMLPVQPGSPTTFSD